MTGNGGDVPRWPANSEAGFVDELINWLKCNGRNCYEEEVSQLEHALQAAWLADRAKDTDAAIAAALLHDVGHLSSQALLAAEKHPHLAGSIVLRRRDDAAKVAGRRVPDLEVWRRLLESLMVMPPINELS